MLRERSIGMVRGSGWGSERGDTLVNYLPCAIRPEVPGKWPEEGGSVGSATVSPHILYHTEPNVTVYQLRGLVINFRLNNAVWRTCKMRQSGATNNCACQIKLVEYVHIGAGPSDVPDKWMPNYRKSTIQSEFYVPAHLDII
ncbi:hypothetical protein J6590_091166 [Homalodisca vitripennis]|nr:hypothetical protein J6590_091166 [Homalodisca vitripennis]